MSMPDPALTLAGRGNVDESYPVGIAQGILMERYEVSSPVAAEMLLRHAVERRLPIVEIAHWLIATRRLI